MAALNPTLARLLALCRLDRRWVRGEGVWLFDEAGRWFLDGYAQYGAVALGHNAPAPARALREALDEREPAMVQPYRAPHAEALADELVALAPAGLAHVVWAAGDSNIYHLSFNPATSAIVTAEHAFGSTSRRRTPGLDVDSEGNLHVVLTSTDIDGDGPAAYWMLDNDGDVLIDAIEHVAAGQSMLDPMITTRLLSWVRTLDPGATGADRNNSLSPQEQRVLALIAEGKTNKEVGADLNLSEKTVRNYLSNIFDKLQVTRRAQAAALFVRQQSNA